MELSEMVEQWKNGNRTSVVELLLKERRSTLVAFAFSVGEDEAVKLIKLLAEKDD